MSQSRGPAPVAWGSRSATRLSWWFGSQWVDEICDVDITAPDAEWLASFVRSLVNDRLAASGNVVAPVQSIYRWGDGIEQTTEAKVVLHTRRSHVPAIIERLEREHPYDIPGIRVIPVTTSDAYHQWILDSTNLGRTEGP